ncbi:MAG: anti-anti-sigma factor [Epulopiscium sp. Nele67-Bin001]|nr:MAG: anti-anti-sigma factor [Epulopiscium sp. Nuni2H_MBin001]OON94492.1 MAG: anti-anti-sigma factor [Epulopiscium sp. Nele67-Bin001]
MITQIKNNVLCVTLDGEIDSYTASHIREEVDRLFQINRLTHIIFDFENVTFMDSSGIGLLMGRYRNVAIGGGQVVLIKVRPEIDKVMKLSGIYKLIKNYTDEKDALAHL